MQTSLLGRVWPLLFSVLALAGVASPAQATVAQPNGSIVPIDSRAATNEKQVYDVFKAADIAAGLNFKTDANTAPEVFSPLCSFTAEMLLKETSSDLAIGWYNVKPGATVAPTPAEIYVVIPVGSRPPIKITGQSIKDDPRYAGGLIGFALVASAGFATKYSERKWNTACTDVAKCPTGGNWIHSITYVSKAIPNAFYLGFEDGNASASAFNNDGDYNDYMFLFTGLTCNGGGKPCTVPTEKGICAAGVNECNSAGTVTCKRVNNPAATDGCDGFDNDCDGDIDEDAACPSGQTCDRGSCTTSCSGEFPCPANLICDRGHCVAEVCATGLSCPSDTVCRGSACVSPCDGIKCPGTQTCRLGRCVDACAGVTCAMGQICQNGACVIGCDCYPCGDPAQGCSKSSNICVETACVDRTCNTGEVCRGGQCVSSCSGAVCPSGQECQAGNCVDLPAVVIPGPTPMNPEEFGGGGAVVAGCGCRLAPDRSSSTSELWALPSALGIATFVGFRRSARARRS